MIITRRRLLGAAALGGAGLALKPGAPTRLAEAAAEAANFVQGPPVEDRPLVAVSPHIHIIRALHGTPTPENKGLMSNITFVVGDKGVVVIDTGSSRQIADMTIRQLRRLTPKPVIGILVTPLPRRHRLRLRQLRRRGRHQSRRRRERIRRQDRQTVHPYRAVGLVEDQVAR